MLFPLDTTPPSLVSVLQRERQTLPPITHPMGELSVSATYLSSPNFQLDTLESLLSSRFLSLEEGPDFTPTLVKNQQRDSISGSPGSLPLRTSLPRSPPRSVVDRFVLPPPSVSHTRSGSFSSNQAARGSPSGSPRLGNIPLPVTRNLSGAGMGTSGVSDSSSSRQGAASLGSREEISALAARMRRDSLQARTSVRTVRVDFNEHTLMYTVSGQCLAQWGAYTSPGHQCEPFQVIHYFLRFSLSELSFSVPSPTLTTITGDRTFSPIPPSSVPNVLTYTSFTYRGHQFPLVACNGLPSVSAIRAVKFRLRKTIIYGGYIGKPFEWSSFRLPTKEVLE